MSIADDGAGRASDPEAPGVRLRPEVARSATPVVGRAITGAKRALLRLLHQPIEDLADQTTAAIDRSRTEAREVGAQAREAGTQAREAREWAEAALAAEAAAREGAQADIAGLLRRLGAIEQELERLQIAPRMARLERARRPEPAPTTIETPARGPGDGPPPAEPPVDYLAFEARFRGAEETIRARQSAYVELLAGARRVVDLGCGRGELVQLLSEAGVDAYGVDTNADFVDLVAANGLEVVRQDLMRHLEDLAPGEVDAIVVSHVVEHLPPHVVSHLVRTAWDRLPEGGLLIIETPNPESLVAGSVNFHRDPTHLRPVHPDTLAFVCESTGFADVAIRRLSPVPDDDRLPGPAPGDDPLAEYVDRVVARLDALLYGFQDYAVVARR